MATIIAGRFQQQAQVQDVVEALQRAGFPEDRIVSFYVNPPGQHDMYALGGDVEKSSGAEETDKSAVAGVAVGAVAGIAASPVLGPTAPLLGAYVGALVGGLAGTKEAEESESEEDKQRPNHVPCEHRSGLLVAVAAADADGERNAISTLQSAGALDIERAEGTIQDGDWVDFDPLLPPHLIDRAPERRV